MVQVLGSAERPDKVVSVTSVVRGTADLAQVGNLVDEGGGLGLGVAATAGSGHLVEEDAAVGLVRLRGDSVGNDTARASTAGVDVSAVEAGNTTGGGATLGGNAVENTSDGGASGGRRRLEELSHLGSVGVGLGSGGGGEGAAVGKAVDDGGAAGTSAVRLDNGALEESTADLGSLSTIDGGGNSVAAESNSALDLDFVRRVGYISKSLTYLGGVDLGKRHSSSGNNVEAATSAQVVHLSNVKGLLKGLASSNDLEGIILELVQGNLEADTLESNLRLCLLISTVSGQEAGMEPGYMVVTYGPGDRKSVV